MTSLSIDLWCSIAILIAIFASDRGAFIDGRELNQTDVSAISAIKFLANKYFVPKDRCNFFLNLTCQRLSPDRCDILNDASERHRFLNDVSMALKSRHFKKNNELVKYFDYCTQHIDPVPFEFIAPAEPAPMAAPVETVTPVKPVEPVPPVAPVPPVEPIPPVEPVRPVEPIAPIEPIPPIAPIEPIPPLAPVEAVPPAHEIPVQHQADDTALKTFERELEHEFLKEQESRHREWELNDCRNQSNMLHEQLNHLRLSLVTYETRVARLEHELQAREHELALRTHELHELEARYRAAEHKAQELLRRETGAMDQLRRAHLSSQELSRRLDSCVQHRDRIENTLTKQLAVCSRELSSFGPFPSKGATTAASAASQHHTSVITSPIGPTGGRPVPSAIRRRAQAAKVHQQHRHQWNYAAASSGPGGSTATATAFCTTGSC